VKHSGLPAQGELIAKERMVVARAITPMIAKGARPAEIVPAFPQLELRPYDIHLVRRLARADFYRKNFISPQARQARVAASAAGLVVPGAAQKKMVVLQNYDEVVAAMDALRAAEAAWEESQRGKREQPLVQAKTRLKIAQWLLPHIQAGDTDGAIRAAAIAEGVVPYEVGMVRRLARADFYRSRFHRPNQPEPGKHPLECYDEIVAAMDAIRVAEGAGG
jgi:hypothetical protein